MVYAQGRTFYDADSHLMELVATGSCATPTPTCATASARSTSAARARWRTRPCATAEARRGDAAGGRRARARRDGRRRVGRRSARSTPPNAAACSTCSASTRSSCSARSPRRSSRADDLELLYGGTRAHNRAMVDFCAADRRLIAGRLRAAGRSRPRASRRRDEAIALGCGAILVPSAPPRDKSPTHPDYMAVWARLEETGVPFMLHVGGGGRPLRPRVPRERQAAGHRLPRRRREHPLQGLHGAPPPAGDRSSRAWCSTGSSSSSRACAAAASSRARCGSCRCSNGSTSRRRRSAAPSRRSTLPLRPSRLPPPAGEVHAVPDRAGRLDDRAGGRRAVPVLVRLPAPRRRRATRSAASRLAREPSTTSREGALLLAQLRRDDGTGARRARVDSRS